MKKITEQEIRNQLVQLRNGDIDPSPKRLVQAEAMAKHYNAAHTGDSGLFSVINAAATTTLAAKLDIVAAETLLQPSEASVARSLLPEVRVPDGAETYTLPIMEREGRARPIANWADDPQMVTLARESVTRKMISYGMGFTWSAQDVARAALDPSFDLPSEGLAAALLAYEEGVDQALSLGEPDFGLNYGLANQPVGTGASQVRSTAVGLAADWVGATVNAEKMYQDLSNLIAEHAVDSLGQFEPTDLLLAPESYGIARSARLSADGKTVLEALKNNNPQLNIKMWSKLSKVDSGSTGTRGLLYSRNPRVACALMGRDFVLNQPMAKNFAFVASGFGSTGGTVIKTPVGLRYLTGLPTS